MSPIKHINPGTTHGFIGETKSKSKPKPYVEAQWIADYRKQRDMCMLGDMWVSEETKEQIREKYQL